MASLIVVSGSDQGKWYPLGRRTSVVGRDEGVLIQVLDQHVSRKHVQIRYNSDTDLYYASDMKSRHGTFINGDRIHNETPLSDADTIDVGGVTLQFTQKDFDSAEGALAFYRHTGEQARNTVME